MEKNDERFFEDIMPQSDLEMPFGDFEDEVMMQIQKQKAREKAISTDRTLSWIFFVAGTIFGVIISLLLPNISIPVPGITSEQISLVFQVFLVLFVMLQLESLLSSTKQADKNKDLSLRSR